MLLVGAGVRVGVAVGVLVGVGGSGVAVGVVVGCVPLTSNASTTRVRPALGACTCTTIEWNPNGSVYQGDQSLSIHRRNFTNN